MVLSTGDEFFTEEQTPGVRLSLRVKSLLVEEKTPYQFLQVFETAEHGRLLTLDGRVMLTERDEYLYHEMLVHPALFTHPDPREVVIVGGGDGGAVREVLRHPTVEGCTLVEIDRAVVEVSRKFLPGVSKGAFNDSRTRLLFQPGEKFVAEHVRSFDAILVDSTDPIGAAAVLFGEAFFAAAGRALRPGGILAMQCGSPFYSYEHVVAVLSRLRTVFREADLYLGFTPTYPSGMWAYALASDSPLDRSEQELAARIRGSGIDLQFYSARVHRAAFAFAHRLNESCRPAR